jgi:hypothetical protein
MMPSIPRRPVFSPFCGLERRTSVRHPCKVRVAYQPGTGAVEGPWARGTVLDVSATGIRLLLAQAIDAGAVLTVALPRMMRGQRRLLQAQVVRTSVEADGRWAAGCTLVGCKLTNDEIQSLPAHRMARS